MIKKKFNHTPISQRKIHHRNLDGPTVVIGERINPTGCKAVLAADLSLGKDEFGMRWIKAYRKRKKTKQT